MRSALICVFVALLVRTKGSTENDEDFKPMPIPLNDWRGQTRAAGTLHELIKTDAPPTVVAVPAHYWEDALRHSVYLTLVRDKIDQLIVKGAPDNKPDSHLPKEIDDHDLWEKIKTARFDRLKEVPIPPAEVTILAKGRLLEDKDGFRFAEDDAQQEKCSADDCSKSVKAYWSVKRFRQSEPAGKYHYELTFAVTSQTPMKVKKPYENPVRTFTVRENSPTEKPVATKNNEYVLNHQARPQRAIWFHKNIVPTQTHQRRPATSHGLDRIFTSFFSDDDSGSYEEPTYRYKQGHNTYVPQMYSQHAKVAYSDREPPYHQKKMLPFPVKPPMIRYSRPPLQPPPLSYLPHSYLDADTTGNNPYFPPYSDNRYGPSNIVKTTRPAVLPTPITNFPSFKEPTNEVPVKTKLNTTEYSYTSTEAISTTYKIHNNQKKPQMNVNYFPEHLRPPVYNAPPGVFVTMDKKPFKPMPPLKFAHSGKPMKNMPVDFRPSPQVLDTQFSDPSSIAVDNAFRPININYTDIFNSNANDSNKKVNKNNRKPSTAKKPPKKHVNIKSQHVTTVVPDIITAHSDLSQEEDSMEWANLLGAFTKTTPMDTQTEKGQVNSDPIITTTPLPTTSEEDDDIYVSATSSQAEPRTSTASTTTSTSTTTKSKKRTRPPPSFKKIDTKKQKRVTTTTTTTVRPTRKYPAKNRTSDDLTLQASSAATSGVNSLWDSKPPKPVPTTTMPSTTVTISTNPTTTTTTATTTRQTTRPSSSTASTSVDARTNFTTTHPINKNRFRQSTLMLKGTSVKHDKWSVPVLEKNRTNTVSPAKLPKRRVASKFHGYIPSTTPRQPDSERNKERHEDRVPHVKNEDIISSTQHYNEEDIQIKTSEPTQASHNEQESSEESSSEWDHDDDRVEDSDDVKDGKQNTNDVQESKDEKEYIFPSVSTTDRKSDDNAEIQSITEATVFTSPLTVTKNKTKCKKKKHQGFTTIETWSKPSETPTTPPVSVSSTTTTTTESATPDFLADLFSGFTMDDTAEKPAPTHFPVEAEPSGSEKHEHYAHIDDDIESFLHSLDEKNNQQETNISEEEQEEYDEDDDDEDNEDEDSPFNNDEENEYSRHFNNEYYDDDDGETQESRDKPYSLLELMAGID